MNCIKWIKVGNDKPKEGVKLLIWVSGYGLTTGKFYGEEPSRFVTDNMHGDWVVTHYAEINEPINY